MKPQLSSLAVRAAAYAASRAAAVLPSGSASTAVPVTARLGATAYNIQPAPPNGAQASRYQSIFAASKSPKSLSPLAQSALACLKPPAGGGRKGPPYQVNVQALIDKFNSDSDTSLTGRAAPK